MPAQIASEIRDGDPFLIGRWLVEPTLNRLTLGTTSVQLEHKAMDVLLCLVENAGEVVSKNDLLDSVWQTEFVSDNTLQGRIAEIRDAVGDDAKNPSFIETIRKKGYRLICEIGTPDPDDPVQSSPNSPTKPDEDRNPYPGLAAFTEEDTDVFFGREHEIASLWRKITSRRLLAVIGPSGIGKSSLLRAGVATRAPPGWRVLVFTPGENPAMSLARALAPDHAGDPSAVSRLVGFNDPDTALAVVSRWRGQFDDVVLVVDQFEELFTLNSPETKTNFIQLLRRLVDAADIHVVLAMRDDYLHQCQRFPEIAPIFDGLTPLGAPDGEGLRRAITEPAARLLHRFESEILVDRMIAEVEEQRGALPLLAFAVRRLWERRNSEERILTEAAYDEIGGVGGALARHAEMVVAEIGHERLPVVREIFRNLVTAEGTRAVREVDELLSVFEGKSREGIKPSPTTIPSTPTQKSVGEGFIPSRDAAQEVLDKLTEARLLTTFETHDDEELSTRRVEIVHESLLANWPRLVRWQTQDADGAQLRDQLRRAARTWEEHDRAADYLWKGKAYREFAVWRETYPGGLSETEESFGCAMTAHAKRRNKRRRTATVAAFLGLLFVLTAVGTLWRRGMLETRRAEAANLVSLGQLELEGHPSAAVAHAIASLELADWPGARRLALEALWKGPTALVANEDSSWEGRFSQDGRWLAHSRRLNFDDDDGHLRIINAGGSSKYLENSHPESPQVTISAISESGHFVTSGQNEDSSTTIAIRSSAEGASLAETTLEPSRVLQRAVVDSGRRRAVLLIREDHRISVDALEFDGTHHRLGALEFEVTRDDAGRWTKITALDPRAGAWFGVFTGSEVHVVDVGDHGLGPARFLGRHDGAHSNLACDPLGRFFTTGGEDGEIRFWSLTKTAPPVVIQGPPDSHFSRFTPDGSLFEAAVEEDGNWITWVWDLTGESPRFLRRFNLGETGRGVWKWDTTGRQVAKWGPDTKIRIWSMNTPVDSEPFVLNRGDNQQMNDLSFNPRGGWLATADLAGLAFWPLARNYPSVIQRHERDLRGLVFAPDGSWIASTSTESTVRLWPLVGDPPPPSRELGRHASALAVSPDGSSLLGGEFGGDLSIRPIDGGPPRNLAGFHEQIWGVAFSPDGLLAAAVGGQFDPTERVIRIWDTASGEEVRVLEVGERPVVFNLQFTRDGHLLSMSESGLLRWNVKTGERELLYEGVILTFAASPDGRRVLMVERENTSDVWGRAFLLELDTGATTLLDRFGDDVSSVALDPTGTIAFTGNRDGDVWVGPMTGEAPHLLLGHKNTAWALAVDPLGRWVASGDFDGVIRLWPMPDLTKPPLHTLPREELIAKLKTLTNLRVVRDPESSTGWKLTHDPFPGWETVPTW